MKRNLYVLKNQKLTKEKVNKKDIKTIVGFDKPTTIKFNIDRKKFICYYNANQKLTPSKFACSIIDCDNKEYILFGTIVVKQLGFGKITEDEIYKKFNFTSPF